jgi:hypothetical protein
VGLVLTSSSRDSVEKFPWIKTEKDWCLAVCSTNTTRCSGPDLSTGPDGAGLSSSGRALATCIGRFGIGRDAMPSEMALLLGLLRRVPVF